MPPSPQRKTLFFSLRCGCRDSKSVSVSEKTPSKPPEPKPVTPTTDTIFSSETLTSSFDNCSAVSGDSSSSFSGLLRQLNELEQSVIAWNSRPQQLHGSDCGRVGESVAVVKDSDDPLTDFRRSMLQMIVEKEIVGAEELKELLGRFLALNEKEHHEVIVRAFEEIWSELFSGYYDNAPELLTELKR
ncbi:transcription repressor OFP4-like protein [Cinnamomum micranthum f. kanehirae]|uniref:Transcription repressor n=1 Tax=Cinnamomum micranthum f. kanehirae TaxID=337451 RepID=A0A3S3PAA2_9MAGN|nr:transcription repressor OFP4-like protein [Cinnamomum micranthum f. kanehirae]